MQCDGFCVKARKGRVAQEKGKKKNTLAFRDWDSSGSSVG